MDKKLTINLTPKIKSQIKDEEKAINRISIDSKGISYTHDYNYEDSIPIRDSENQPLGKFEYNNIRKEVGRIKREHLTAVSRSSHVIVIQDEFDPSKFEPEVEHLLIIEGFNSNIAMTCTFEELKKFYPIIEDYYNDGNDWERHIQEENNKIEQ